MKKLITIFLSALILLFVFVFAGCEKSSKDNVVGEIEIEVLSPLANDSITISDSVSVTVKLSGFTFEYAEINYYFGAITEPAGVFDKNMLSELALTQEEDAQFDYMISTAGLSTDVSDSTYLIVEAVSNDNEKYIVQIPVILKLPTIDDETSLDMIVVAPALNDTLKVGDIIDVDVELAGNQALFKSMIVNLQSDSIYSAYEINKLDFNFPSANLEPGRYTLEFLLDVGEFEPLKRYRSFTLIEYIPTFISPLGEAGYALKSIIQTYDNGYLAVSSDSLLGTKIVKFSQEGLELWNRKLTPSVGVGMSVCEDTEYDKGYVIAGWRIAGDGLKDTWVRKISLTDGSLIWNEHYGFINVDDGATVIKKSIDDGYLIGGYTKNILGTGTFTLECPNDTTTYSYETGYDVRLLKIYSNGNGVWGHSNFYTSNQMWWDITGHEIPPPEGETHPHHYIKKMGDQFVNDLVIKDDGSFYITGWYNSRLYDSGPNGLKKDMFFAEVDHFGGYISTLTWSTMGAYDIGHMSNADSFIKWGHTTSGIGFSVIPANHLGDYSEDEISNGLVESYGSYDGDVVMAGETYQLDDGPVKSKLYDAWVVEYKMNGDEDGALWEYTFGDAAKSERAYGIDRTKDGGYVITGHTTGTNKNTWLFKLNAELILQWSKDLGDTAYDDYGVKVVQTTDGGLVVGGNVITGSGVCAKVFKLNKKGEQ